MMKNIKAILKRIILCLVIIVVIGLLGISAWHQWNENQKTIIERMRQIPPTATYVHGGPISYIAFDPKNPELIATGGVGTDVKVWNLTKLDTPHLTLEVKKDNDGVTLIVGLAFSPIDNWIATKTIWTLEIWDSTSGDKINTLNFTSSNFAISLVGNNFALGGDHITLWNANNPKNVSGKTLLPPQKGWDPIYLDGLERTDPYPEEKINIIRHNIPTDYLNASKQDNFETIDFSPDERWLAAGGKRLNENREWKQIVKIWDLNKHQLYKIMYRDELKIHEPKRKDGKVRVNKLPTSNEIRSIKFSPDNRFLGLAAYNGLTIRSLPDWEKYHEVVDEEIRDIAFSPDGTMYAVIDATGITLWSLETLTPIALLDESGIFGTRTIEFSPDGRTLAGGGFSGVLSLWDVSKINEN